MKNNIQIPDLSKKLKIYKRHGVLTARPVFEAGIPEYFQPSKHKSYGRLYLYDDMTEKDLLSLFRCYKKERNKRIKTHGIKVRKHITKNIIRGIEWSRMVNKYKNQPNYKKISIEWSKKNTEEVIDMVLKYLWKIPEDAFSTGIQNRIRRAKVNGKIFDSFIIENKKFITVTRLKKDIQEYITFYLPRRIRSAVYRRSRSK